MLGRRWGGRVCDCSVSKGFGGLEVECASAMRMTRVQITWMSNRILNSTFSLFLEEFRYTSGLIVTFLIIILKSNCRKPITRISFLFTSNTANFPSTSPQNLRSMSDSVNHIDLLSDNPLVHAVSAIINYSHMIPSLQQIITVTAEAHSSRPRSMKLSKHWKTVHISGHGQLTGSQPQRPIIRATPFLHSRGFHAPMPPLFHTTSLDASCSFQRRSENPRFRVESEHMLNEFKKIPSTGIYCA